MHKSGDGDANEEEVEGTHHVSHACGKRAIEYYDKTKNMLPHSDGKIPSNI